MHQEGEGLASFAATIITGVLRPGSSHEDVSDPREKYEIRSGGQAGGQAFDWLGSTTLTKQAE